MTTEKRRERLIQQVREIAQDLSGIGIDRITPTASFLELGFDSLFLTQLSATCQKSFGLKITFRQLFNDLPTIAALGTYLDQQLPAEQMVTRDSAEEKPAVPAETTRVPVSIPAAPPTLPAPVPSVSPVFTQAASVVAIQPAPVLLDEALSAGIESVLVRQLELMSAQLQLLQASSISAPIGISDALHSARPVVVEPSTPPASVEAAIPESQAAKAPLLKSEAPTPPSGFGPGAVKNGGLQPLPAPQQKHLDSLIERYTRKTAGSKERTQRHRKHLADPRTAAGFSRRWKEMVYPIWVERSQGSKLWDVDGNEYVDLLNGFGPHFLGHAPAYVTRAIAEQLQRGYEIGPQTLLVGEVAEMICKLTGMERASFTCSGSEAVQAAMRLSRTYTGRDKVVVFSRDYHGNFDQVLVHHANRDGKLRTLPSAPGIPFQSVDDTYVLEYGTDEALELIKKHAGDIAAVIVEPVQSRRPEFQPRTFLHELRRITRESGIVLVFDEVVTGFRCAPGGAQAYFGVDADLATYGKVIGGGMPIGVVAGRGSVMDIFDGGFWRYGDDSFPEAGVTFFAGTFVRHPLAIAAAHAALKYIIHEGPALQQRVAAKADRFAGHVNDLFKKYEVDAELPHFTSQMYLRMKEKSELASLLAYHLRYRGVHIAEGFPSYMTDAHSEQDIEHLECAFTDSVEAMVADGIFGNRSKLTKAVGSTPKRDEANAKHVPLVASANTQTIDHSTTALQKEMWIAAQMRPEASAASNGTNVVELLGDLNIDALERALDEVVKRHEALRSTFSDDGSSVIVHGSLSPKMRLHDLSTLSPAEAAAGLTDILRKDGQQVFNLSTGPLFSFQLIKLAANKHLLVFTAQMIVCDGWGFKVVLEEVSAIYSAIVEHREWSLEPPRQMREYTAWQAQELGSAAMKDCEEFWLNQFTTVPASFDLPAKLQRPAVRTYDAARANLRLSREFYQEIKRASREHRNTAFSFLLAAFSSWLYRLSGNSDFVVGVPYAGQGELGLSNLVGQCVHTLPFRVTVARAASFLDQLNQTQKLILDGQEHWNANLGTLIQRLNLPPDPSRIALAPVIFNLDPALTSVQFSNCETHITSGPRFYFHYDLGFNIIDEGDTLLVECDYNTTLFDRDTIQYWLNGFEALLREVAADASRPLRSYPMLDESKRPIQTASARRAFSLSPSSSSSSPPSYMAPHTDTEKRLAHLWCQTLSLPRVSTTANFFEVGGQSLSAVSLFTKIEKEFGKRLPLATLFVCPTIQKLACAVQGSQSRETWSPLVPINLNGSQPALFLVHGAGGNVLLYRSLGEHLAPDVPLYGLQSIGLDGESQPLRTIEEMADCYVRELKTVQPKGPYYLGGYCLGGTVAYEMAQILSREGEQVPLVAMLDTYNYSRALKVSFRSFLFQKAKFHLANLTHLRLSHMIRYVKEKTRLGLGGELANLKTSMPGSSCPEGVSRATSGAEAKVQAINDYAAESYNPQPYGGQITLFKPRFNYKFYPDPNMGWGDLARGGLDIVEVAVNPHSMLLEPYVKVLADQLKERIAGPAAIAGRRASVSTENELACASND